LKLCANTPAAKATAYGKYLEPGGYDYYWRLKAMAHAMTVEGKPYVDCEKVILGIKDETKRKYNLAGLKSLARWLEKEKEQSKFFAPPSALCTTPKGYLTIRLAPEFGIESKAGRRLVTLWNVKAPAMTQKIAATGIYLKQQHLQMEQFSDCKCAIFDLRKAAMFVSDVVPTEVATIVAKEFAWVDSFFEQAADKSEKKPAVIGAILS
jgi:hypothetical protein